MSDLSVPSIDADGEDWPPGFTIDQERILNLLTGDRFYSSPSAALRESILNSIDSVHRRRAGTPDVIPHIIVTFDRVNCVLEVNDNGTGMSKSDIEKLFAKIGASASTIESQGGSVGEFGIGVVSYFMAGDEFDVHTFDGDSEPIGLTFNRSMLAGGRASVLSPTRTAQGTTVTIRIRNQDVFEELVESYSHWCHDVDGLSAQVLPDGTSLKQRGRESLSDHPTIELPVWVERASLRPVSNPTGWEAMTGNSSVSVLYRGVFVQEYEVDGIWGIEGSLDVDPKHFKPRLNREGFISGQFQREVSGFLKSCHPAILEQMAQQLSDAVDHGLMGKWSGRRWATLWLSLPREERYYSAIKLWDSVFRSFPAFEMASGNSWVPSSFDEIIRSSKAVYVAPIADAKSSDVIQSAVRLLRNTGEIVVRGIRAERSWMRHASRYFGTTADLNIKCVFV